MDHYQGAWLRQHSAQGLLLHCASLTVLIWIVLKHLPVPSRKNCGGDTARLIDYDLQHLGVDHVDLMLIHFPPDLVPTGCTLFGACQLIQEQWAALEVRRRIAYQRMPDG